MYTYLYVYTYVSADKYSHIQERAFQLLEETPPRARAGAFVRTLKQILQRENNWTVM